MTNPSYTACAICGAGIAECAGTDLDGGEYACAECEGVRDEVTTCVCGKMAHEDSAPSLGWRHIEGEHYCEACASAVYAEIAADAAPGPLAREIAALDVVIGEVRDAVEHTEQRETRVRRGA